MERSEEYIEQYLKGDLSQEETREFENEMENDPVLKRDVEDHRELLRGIELGFNQELKSILKNEEHRILDGKPEAKGKSLNQRYIFGIAAAIALIIASVFVFRSPEVEPQTIYANYYEDYPNIEDPVARSDNSSETAFDYYENSDYEKALEAFIATPPTEMNQPAIDFYSGICYLELDRGAKAISSLKSVTEQPENKYSRPAMWYLALAYLKENELGKATSIFKELQNRDDNYGRKAEKILAEIEESL